MSLPSWVCTTQCSSSGSSKAPLATSSPPLRSARGTVCTWSRHDTERMNLFAYQQIPYMSLGICLTSLKGYLSVRFHCKSGPHPRVPDANCGVEVSMGIQT